MNERMHIHTSQIFIQWRQQKLPLLVLANKIDLGPKITEQELIKGLNLDYVVDNPWLLVPISAKMGTNIDQVDSRRQGKKTNVLTRLVGLGILDQTCQILRDVTMTAPNLYEKTKCK